MFLTRQKIQYLINYLKYDNGWCEDCNIYKSPRIPYFNYETSLYNNSYIINIYYVPNYINQLDKFGNFNHKQKNYMVCIAQNYEDQYSDKNKWNLVDEENGIEKIEKELKKVPIFKSYYRNIKIDKLL